MISLEQSLKNWDQKSTDCIQSIYDQFSEAKSFVSDLVKLMESPELQKASTWLLKHHLEKKHQIECDQICKIFALLSNLVDWESKLHILQCFSYLLISNKDKKSVEFFLRDCLNDSNKFVRAWTYNGFYELSKQHPEFIDETKQLFEMAMRDEAASIKARIRNILKTGF